MERARQAFSEAVARSCRLLELTAAKRETFYDQATRWNALRHRFLTRMGRQPPQPPDSQSDSDRRP